MKRATNSFFRRAGYLSMWAWAATLTVSAATPSPDSSNAKPAAVAIAKTDLPPDEPHLGPDPSSDGESLGYSLARMAVVLIIVVGVIYLTLNVGLRRLMGIKQGTLARGSVVTVVERVPLDQKKSIYVLKAAGEYLLVGGSDGGLSLLCKLDAAEVERIERAKGAGMPALSPFLQKLLSRRGNPPPPSA